MGTLGVELDVVGVVSKKMTTPSWPSVRWTARGWVHGPASRAASRREGPVLKPLRPADGRIRLLFESPSDGPAETERRQRRSRGGRLPALWWPVTAMTLPLGPEGPPGIRTDLIRARLAP